MKNTLYLLLVTLFFSSCAIKQQIAYEKTNVALIHKSIKNLKTLENLQSNISKTDMIAIVGIENYVTFDHSIYASLEDEIIKEFVTAGYKILERDEHMVKRLVSESESTYRDLIPLKEGAGTISGQGEKSSSNSQDVNINITDKTDKNASGRDSENGSSSRSREETNFISGYPTLLNSADKIISYRVIENGMIYDYEEKEAKIDEVEREARTILEVRLTDAKSGEILKALTLDGRANDFVEKKDISALKQFSYNYYRQTLPATYGWPPAETIKVKEFNPWPVLGSVFGGVFLLLLIF